MTDRTLPTELQHLSPEKQKFFLFLTTFCYLTYDGRSKRGTHWVLRFTSFDTRTVYVVRQDDFTPAKQWLRITHISDEVSRVLHDKFMTLFNTYLENDDD